MISLFLLFSFFFFIANQLRPDNFLRDAKTVTYLPHTTAYNQKLSIPSPRATEDVFYDVPAYVPKKTQTAATRKSMSRGNFDI